MCHGQILSTRIQRARREHRCGECRRTISVGQERYVQVQKDGGDLLTYECCVYCAAQMDAFARDYDDGGCVLFTREDARETLDRIGWATFRERVRAAAADLRKRFGRKTT